MMSIRIEDWTFKIGKFDQKPYKNWGQISINNLNTWFSWSN